MAAEFDREFVADEFGPPSPDARARHRRAERKRGRPRAGDGSKAISVTIEESLLRRVDALARRKKTPRAQLVARGLRAVLAAERRGGRSRRRAATGKSARVTR